MMAAQRDNIGLITDVVDLMATPYVTGPGCDNAVDPVEYGSVVAIAELFANVCKGVTADVAHNPDGDEAGVYDITRACGGLDLVEGDTAVIFDNPGDFSDCRESAGGFCFTDGEAVYYQALGGEMFKYGPAVKPFFLSLFKAVLGNCLLYTSDAADE